MAEGILGGLGAFGYYNAGVEQANQQAQRRLQGILGAGQALAQMENMQNAPVRAELLRAQADMARAHANQYGAAADLQRQKIATDIAAQDRQNAIFAYVLETLKNRQGGASGMPQGAPPAMTAGMPSGSAPAPAGVLSASMPGATQPVAAGVPGGVVSPMFDIPTATALGLANKNMGEMAFKGIESARHANTPRIAAAGSIVMNPDGTERQLPGETPKLLDLVNAYDNATQRYHQTGIDHRPGIEALIRSKYPNEAETMFKPLGRTPASPTSGSPGVAGGVPPSGSEDTRRNLNQSWLKTHYEPAIAEARSASDTLVAADTARQAMRRMGGTGAFTEMKAEMARVLEGLGFASDRAMAFTRDAAIFNKAVFDRSWALLNAAKGVQTEGDAQRANKVFAQLKNPTEANEYVLDQVEAVAQRNKLKAQFFDDALASDAGRADHTRITREWNRREPSIFEMPSMKKWAAKAPK